jgi:hypothetical protein
MTDRALYAGLLYLGERMRRAFAIAWPVLCLGGIAALAALGVMHLF